MVNNTKPCEELNEVQKRDLLDQSLKMYNYDENSLIQILHMAQSIYGYLPIDVQEYIADQMSLPLAKVSGVISFYTLFTTEPKGKYVIKVCLGTACYVRGGKNIISRIKELIGIDIAETTEDRKFTLEITRCIGACGLAPAIAINDQVYMQVNQDRLSDILDELE